MEHHKPWTRKILVLTSHGIRTNARWQKALEQLVLGEVERRNTAVANREPGTGDELLEVTFRHNDYRYFSIFSFLNPFRRRAETNKFQARLHDYIKADQFDEIHLVGHSFGTHIIGHSLLGLGKRLGKKVNTVILAGSVLPGSFPWDSLFRSGIRRLVNECGDFDMVLVLNAILPFGSGLAGRRGFAGITGDHFRNRFFRFGHSGYFEKGASTEDELWFMRQYWLPLILGEAAIPYVDERDVSPGRYFVGWLVDQSENLKWTVPAGLAAALALVFLYFALVSRTSFNLETLDMAGQIASAVERRQLVGLEQAIATRETAIEDAAASLMSRLEGLVRKDAAASYHPVQWERARLAAKFAIRRKIALGTAEVVNVRSRGENFIEVTLAQAYDDETDRSAEPAAPKTETIDLRTGQVSQSRMWEWSGPLAGTDGFVPRDSYGIAVKVRPPGMGQQGLLDQHFQASLSNEGLTLWHIATETPRSSWRPEAWGGVPLLKASPCGDKGAVVALTKDGQGWVLRTGVKAEAFAAPSALVEILGDSTCTRFAGVTRDLSLVTWSDPTRYLYPKPTLRVASFEFSQKDAGLLMINSSDNEASLLRLSADAVTDVKRFAALGASVAAFSPTGKNIAAIVDAVCSVHGVDTLVDETQTSLQASFACPSGAEDAESLGRLVRFLRDDQLVLSTRAHRGSFGDSHLEARDLSTGRTDWLAKASRYDIVSIDATPDGSVIATTAGDSAGEGYGADRGIYVWSTYSHIPVYEDHRDPALSWEARRVWLAADGQKAVVAWQRHDDPTSEPLHETEMVELDPNVSLAFGWSRNNALGRTPWGIALADLDTQARPCVGIPEGAQWAPPMADALKSIGIGCFVGNSVLLLAKAGGKSVQLKLAEHEGGYRLRYRDLASDKEHAVSYEDGTSIGDDIVNFVSDADKKRMFLANKDGSITRLDLSQELRATRIGSFTKGEDRISLDWLADRHWLRVTTVGLRERERIQSILFYDADGSLQRHYEDLAELGAVEGQGGTFDGKGHYWTPIEKTIGQQQVQIEPDLPLETEVLTQRFLMDLDTGETLSFGCDARDYLGSSSITDPLPSLKVSRSGRFVGAANLAPTVGVAQNNTEMRLFDLASRTCLGIFEHGDEIYDFGISDDGRVLVTRGLNETLIWHVPSKTVVHTFFGPTLIVADELGLRVLTRAGSDSPGVWPIPSDLGDWLSKP